MREIVRLSHTKMTKTQKSVFACGCSSVMSYNGTFMLRRENEQERRR